MPCGSADRSANVPASAPSAADSEATKQSLLSVGLRLFSREGFCGASVNEIVREAGCSKGAFYYYFSSKKEFLLSILEHRIAGNNKRLLELCRWEGDTAEWMCRLFETLIDFSQSEPAWRALSAEFMVLGMRDASIRQRIAQMHRDFRDLVTRAITAPGACRGGQLVADPEAVAVALGAMLDGLLIHAAIEPDALPMPETARLLRPIIAGWCKQENP